MADVRKVVRRITPHEARPIADKLYEIAEQLRRIARDMRSIEQELAPTWSGGAKDKYFSSFTPVPDDLTHFASNIDSKAVAVSAISVLVEVEERIDGAFDQGGAN